MQEVNVSGQRPLTSFGGTQFDLDNGSKLGSRAKSSTGTRYHKGFNKLMPADVIYEKRTSS